MGDFYQNGVVTTLHQLNERPLGQLEADLMVEQAQAQANAFQNQSAAQSEVEKDAINVA